MTLSLVHVCCSPYDGLCRRPKWWHVCGLCSWLMCCPVLLANVAACAPGEACAPVPCVAHTPGMCVACAPDPCVACVPGPCVACAPGPFGGLCYWPVWQPVLLARVGAYVGGPCGSLCESPTTKESIPICPVITPS